MTRFQLYYDVERNERALVWSHSGGTYHDGVDHGDSTGGHPQAPILVADGKVAPFEGGLDEYKEWVRERQAGGGRREAGGERQVSRKDERRVEAQARRREAQARKPFEKKLAAIEAELEPLQAEATAAEAWLASSEAYEEGQRERMQETLRRQGEIRARISAPRRS